MIDILHDIGFTCDYEIDELRNNADLIASQMILQTQSMFKYDNLPDTINETALELLLQTRGLGVGIMYNDKPYILQGAYAGELNYNYFPSQCVIANPYLNISKVFTIDEDCINIRCDSLSRGLRGIISKWAMLLARSEITLKIKDTMSRTPYLITATSDNAKDSAELFLKRVDEGMLAVIHDNKILNTDDIGVFPTNDTSRGITESIEYHQYLKGSFAHDIGLNANYNMKREYVSNGENGLNDDMLRPLIDDMLECRQTDIERFNKMFGTNISVRLNSSWKYNEETDEAILDNMEEGEENAVVSSDGDEMVQSDTEPT